MLVVNLIGVPCSGKSTSAAYIFSKLKMKGLKCELVTEIAKDMIYEGRLRRLHNQLIVAGEQYDRLDRLRDKVDITITDAPLILQPIYYKRNNCPHPSYFKDIIFEYYKTFDNINYFLKQPYTFDSTGRVTTSEDSDDIHDAIYNMLVGLDIPFGIYSTDINDLDEMCREVEYYSNKGRFDDSCWNRFR